MKYLSFRKLVWAASAAGLVLASTASAETLRLSHNTGDATSWHLGAERFAQLLDEASEGELNVRVFPNAQLSGGDQMRQAEMVGRGALDLLITSAINVTPLVPEMAVFSLPYLYANYDQVDATTQGEPVELLEAIMEEKGIVVLAWGENGFRELTNSVRPIRTPEDIRGLNIRVAGPMYVDVLNELGANPQQMQWTETMTALQQGVVDAQENPIGAVIIPQQIYEVQDYLTTWHYSYDPLFLGISKQRWEGFDEKTQEIIQLAAEQAMAYQIEVTRESTADGLEFLSEQGMQITELSEDEIAAFRAETVPAFDLWAEKIGPEIVSAFVNAVEENGN
ncbi:MULTISPECIES: DctP family TRAP transporter solute-binding subunit [Halomonadaceae]|jgi:tripartite ATP-independent transporter DctP family solute receptor|uniref:Extracellular solute-binding protein, family 7, bacteria n=1 Tax=Vreelandella titanicae BH1 TaxID=1204738 RepID=L9UAH2_9GAMM|nr:MULTISPECIES: DctP family TRAP transporter solute-binding subunit [Halomonas]ELY21920.1 Extracellular solute-binding protein, family 7, bacteria [Halomonas titanicae BH1]MCE7518692.1 DctP family TRAP transporter solute-binding subunit [Halomonas titanicae]NVE90101.1 DctP family TRAP transporter solute-binding subunit [Halomonas titanicae]TMU20218.1 DctP family TRAP transporter solute-binding subunit [Halomonas sp. ATBC28]CAD5268104.1 Extracellular solute-binding protein, family 7, bacteria |tara:strand:+ start:756 stop:1763 length:1008 start_codon:yes stop_codon:yes gene_type:complete